VRKFLSLSFLWLIVATLSACTPEYNWREWAVADERAVIMFPSRTQTEQRPIDVEGIPSTFSLTSSAVGPSVFSVGFIPMPEKLTEAQQTGFVKKVVSALAARAGAPTPDGALEGKIFSLETVVAGKPSLMMARVVIHRGMLIQVVASGPKQSLSNENAFEFVRSLTLR